MTSTPSETLAWIGLNSVPGVGRRTFRKLAAAFGSPGKVLAATPEEIAAVPGVPDKVALAIGSHAWREQAEQELERAESAGVAVLTSADDAFPACLRDIPDAPLYLYVRGTLTAGDGGAVALVGTRTPTQYGLTVTRRMANELAQAGRTVVSGCARGIDTAAHQGALAGGGRTIAVLGCGIDVAYPPENRGLLEEIAVNGAVLSENPFGTRPESGYFPGRNRIISGLAAGTVIIEASEDSGSLITADFARKQSRKLFAVPGNVSSPVSKGSNSLISQGAILVSQAADVLRHLGGRDVPPQLQPPLPLLSPDEAAALSQLTSEPLHIDDLGAKLGSDPGRLSGVLTVLELKGLAKQLPGKYFMRVAT
ncbi:MAG: DNA-processing protein DprA [Nitrospiraceae bacterium]|nr:DNA-processing protein DprA [Nitrospiraceae bacterium]